MSSCPKDIYLSAVAVSPAACGKQYFYHFILLVNEILFIFILVDPEMSDLCTPTFSFNQKLPLIYEVTSQIFDYAPTFNSTKQNKTITAMSNALWLYWSKYLGIQFTITIRSIEKKLQTHMKNFTQQVVKSRRLSRSESYNKYRSSNSSVLNLKSPKSDIDSLKPSQKAFYENQMQEGRPGFVTDILAEELQPDEEIEESSQSQEDSANIYDDPEYYLTQSSQTDESQTEVISQPEDHPPSLRIGKGKLIAPKVKAAIADVSSQTGISVNQAIKATQIICKVLYGHDYFLSKDEFLGTTKENNSLTVLERGQKRKLEELGAAAPHTEEDFKDYQFVLPSAKTIREYKHQQAAGAEADAGVALYNCKEAHLHYDSTSRSHIKGEWPALILHCGKEWYNLRPLYFAYEDKQQICRLFVETLERLAAAASVQLGIPISAKDLWENILSIVTDAASKGLLIESTIKEMLKSEHEPHHVLCKAHTVEGLEMKVLRTLASCENAVELKKRMIAFNPRMASFLQTSSVAEAGLRALTSLVSSEKSATSTSLIELFDYIVEREGASKKITLFKARRWTKQGYCAAVILDAWKYLEMTLQECHQTNLLIETCKLLMDSEFFYSELKVLAYFNHKVCLPLLNAVSQVDQVNLLNLYPKLHEDLMACKVDTLKEYEVIYHKLPVSSDLNSLEKEMVKMLCQSAAEVIELQCGGEYFQTPVENPRATQLHHLPLETVAKFPTHNVQSEKQLSVFSHRAVAAKYGGRNYNAQGVRDNMTLYGAQGGVISSNVVRISKILSERSKDWDAEQKEQNHKRIEEKMRKGLNAENFTNKILNKCKSWGGPCTSPDEVNGILANIDNENMTQKEKTARKHEFIKNEMWFLKRTRKESSSQAPELYRLMQVSDSVMLENLLIILGSDSISSDTTHLGLPTKDEALEALYKLQTPVLVRNPQEGKMVVTVWLMHDGSMDWFLGHVESISEEKYTVNHLVSTTKDHSKWHFPRESDKAELTSLQILPVSVIGEWSLAEQGGEALYLLHNFKAVNDIFKTTEIALQDIPS